MESEPVNMEIAVNMTRAAGNMGKDEGDIEREASTVESAVPSGEGDPSAAPVHTAVRVLPDVKPEIIGKCDSESGRPVEMVEKPTEVLEVMKQEPYEISRNDSILASVTFLLCGAGAVLKWHALIQSAKAISDNMYGFKIGPDSLSILYYLTDVIMGYIVLRWGLLKLVYVHIGLVLTAVGAILFPLSIQLIEDRTTALVVIHVIAAWLGLAMSFTAANTFSFSAITKKNFTGFIVAGNALSGLIAAAVWQLAINVGWDSTNPDELPFAVWCLFGSVIPFIIAAMFCWRELSRRKWFRETSDRYIMVMSDPNMGYRPGSGQSHLPEDLRCRRVPELARACAEPMLLGICAVFVTYALYPNLGPNQWVASRDDPARASGLAAIQQVIDFGGRLAPNVMTFLLLSHKAIRYATYGRMFFFVIYFLFFFDFNVAFFESYATQAILIVIFAFIAGFVTSQSLSDMPKKLKTTAERGIAGIFSHLSMAQGILIGLIVSLAIKFLDPSFSENLFYIPEVEPIEILA